MRSLGLVFLALLIASAILVPHVALHGEQAVPIRPLPAEDLRSASGELDFSIGPVGPSSALGLQSLSWRDEGGTSGGDRWRLSAEAVELQVFAAAGGAPAAPCSLLRAGDGQLDCGGLPVQWSAAAEDLGPHGGALRWILRVPASTSKVQVAAWLPGAGVEGSVDGSPVSSRQRPRETVLSAHALVKASGSFPGKGPERVLDNQFDTEWFAPKGAHKASIEIDLGGSFKVTNLSFQWWAVSMADRWQLESKAEASDAWKSRFKESTAPKQTDTFNAWVRLPGWEDETRYVRLSMRDGHKDPWDFGVYFGLRSIEIVGQDPPATAGPGELWSGGGQQAPPGAWLALEHPRARCTVESAAASRRPGGAAVWRRARCGLELSQVPAGGMDVAVSFGFFADAGASQLRRVFQRHLEVARGRPFGQMLHYNSWYDLYGGACPDASSRKACRSHLMTQASCEERLRAFNGNLSAAGGPPLDAMLLDDGWDNAGSLWDTDASRFPSGFGPLETAAKQWGTRLGVWMSPFGGYGAAGAKRVKFGRQNGFETSERGSFSLAGPKYFQAFREVVERRIREGFGLFKFDGIGGGLGQSGGEAYRRDFDAMLGLVGGMRSLEKGRGEKVWVSLTIGTWPSPFWLLWGDSIWRDGPDVGEEGPGSKRERWLTFRDAALRRALARGPLFPMGAFMQHGVVWSRSRETVDMWPSERQDALEDFCNEVLSFFLSGTGLQELYLQLELMSARHWTALARVAGYARRESKLLADAHPIGGYPLLGRPYGAAAFSAGADGAEAPRGVFWWRNPAADAGDVKFTLAEIFELPHSTVIARRWCWTLQPLQLDTGCPAPQSPALTRPGRPAWASSPQWGPSDEVHLTVQPFAVHAWEALGAPCGK